MNVILRGDAEERWACVQRVRPRIRDLPGRLLPVDLASLPVHGGAQRVRCPLRTLRYDIRDIGICRDHGDTMPGPQVPERQVWQVEDSLRVAIRGSADRDVW